MRKILVGLLLLAGGAAADGWAAEQAQNRINVSSDEVHYQTDGKSATFSGNVVIAIDGLTLHAATLQVQNRDDDNVYIARAGAAPITLHCNTCADVAIRATVQRQVSYDAASDTLRMEGGIQVCAGNNNDCARGQLSADSARWQRGTHRLHLSGAPLVRGNWQTEDNDAPLMLLARKIDYHLASGDLTLRGDARVTRGDDNLSGSVIRANTRTGALQADADSDQRVQATFGTE